MQAQGTLCALEKGHRGDVWKSQMSFYPFFPSQPALASSPATRAAALSEACAATAGWTAWTAATRGPAVSLCFIFFSFSLWGWMWDHSQRRSCRFLHIQPLPSGISLLFQSLPAGRVFFLFKPQGSCGFGWAGSYESILSPNQVTKKMFNVES